jgi:hypothetical protein
MMVVLNPFLSLNSPSDKCLAWIKERLTTANLRVVQTFDLTTAREALDDCPCPHHGTDECDCQMVVLLVYASVVEPATLILHGNDGQTWLSLVERPGQRPDEGTVRAIQKALASRGFAGI